jgi:flavorubredoxin
MALDLFRICTYAAAFNLQLRQFLVRDDEPLLFHTEPGSLFPEVRSAVALIEPATLRWIGFSHVEAGECGALPEWQTVALLDLGVLLHDVLGRDVLKPTGR